MPDQQVAQSETLREIAERIAREQAPRFSGMRLLALADAIEAALRNERERCAKVAEESGTVFYSERQKKHSPYDPKDLIFAQDVCDKIAVAIREGR